MADQWKKTPWNPKQCFPFRRTHDSHSSIWWKKQNQRNTCTFPTHSSSTPFIVVVVGLGFVCVDSSRQVYFLFLPCAHKLNRKRVTLVTRYKYPIVIVRSVWRWWTAIFSSIFRRNRFVEDIIIRTEDDAYTFRFAPYRLTKFPSEWRSFDVPLMSQSFFFTWSESFSVVGYYVMFVTHTLFLLYQLECIGSWVIFLVYHRRRVTWPK